MRKKETLSEQIKLATDPIKIEQVKLEIERRKLQRDDYRNFLLPILNAIPLAAVALTIIFGTGYFSHSRADRIEFMHLVFEKGASKEEVVKVWKNLMPKDTWVDAAFANPTPSKSGQ